MIALMAVNAKCLQEYLSKAIVLTGSSPSWLFIVPLLLLDLTTSKLSVMLLRTNSSRLLHWITEKGDG